MTTIIDNKPMKWAVEAADKVQGWSDDDPAALAIQETAEPILAVVRDAVDGAFCMICQSDKNDHLLNCSVPSALKAMEEPSDE